MSLETTVYSTLTGDAGVSALVSTRIYPNHAPPSAARPNVVYFVVSGTRINTIPGVSDAESKRIQFSCNADTYSAAKALATAVIAAFAGDGYLELQYDLYNPETEVHTVIVDWSFMVV